MSITLDVQPLTEEELSALLKLLKKILPEADIDVVYGFDRPETLSIKTQ